MRNSWYYRLTHYIALTGASILFACFHVTQAGSAADENTLKISYIYNFMKFVEWPEDIVKQNYKLCVLGDNPFGEKLNFFETKNLRGFAITIQTDLSLSNARQCNVIFISQSEAGRLTYVLLNLAPYSILTVSDIEGFADKGGVIELIRNAQGDIIFRVNRESAKKAKLHISSKLLELSH